MIVMIVITRPILMIVMIVIKVSVHSVAKKKIIISLFLRKSNYTCKHLTYDKLLLLFFFFENVTSYLYLEIICKRVVFITHFNLGKTVDV